MKVVNIVLRPFYPRKKTQYLLNRRVGGPRAVLDISEKRKICFTIILIKTFHE
jgi:hypothetical protein